jgi:hypothetical protein
MDNKYKKFQLGLDDEQARRYEEVHRRIQSRVPHAIVSQAQILKILVGFEEPNELITQEDINYLIGKPSRSIHRFAETEDATPDLKGKTIGTPKQRKKIVNGD